MRNWLAAFLSKSWRWGATALLVMLAAAPALAGPTRAGVLKDFTPGQAVFWIVGDDGKAKKVQLTKNARYEVCGRPSASSAFRDGMRVAIRIVGPLNDVPLQADMLMDLYSSSNYVQKTASAPYYTQQGDFAIPGGVGGMSAGTPGITGPNVIGQIGQGGNFPGSTTNPNPGQLPTTPPNNNPGNNPNFPMNQANNAPLNAAPSPSGSPLVGEAVSQMPGMTPGSTQPVGMPYPGSQVGPTYGPGGMPGMSPYSQPGSGMMGPTGGQMMGEDPQLAAINAQSQMMNPKDDDEDEGHGALDGFNMGPQMVQWQARVVTIDPARRMLVVQPAGQPMPQNVLVPPSVAIPPQALQPGAMIQIIGQANSAGFVEAQMIQAMGP